MRVRVLSAIIDNMATDLKGWHPGEVAVQQKLGYHDAVSDRWKSVENSMREQHRVFHTSNLPFIPVTTMDGQDRPWASILAGYDGNIGFVQSPNVHTLTVDARLWDGDPLMQTTNTWLADCGKATKRYRFLTAGLGIEFSTRRRNKFAGWISSVHKVNDFDYQLTLTVNQALGYVFHPSVVTEAELS